MDRETRVFLVSIILLGCIFSVLILITYPYSEPMPPLMLHEVRVENTTNNLLIIFSSDTYNDLELSRIDVTDYESNFILVTSSNVSTRKINVSFRFNYLASIPLGNSILTDYTIYYIVVESNKGRFTWCIDSIRWHQQPML